MASKTMNRWVSRPFYASVCFFWALSSLFESSCKNCERQGHRASLALRQNKSVNNVMKSYLKLRVPP